MRLRRSLLLSAGACLCLTGCDAVRDASDHAANSSKHVIHDTKESWKDLFTYHPRNVATYQLPQTRYCYRMQGDIVCYDSQQANMTAPLVGFQDNEQISWYRRGGGSTGFSAGPRAVSHEGSGSKPVIVVTGVTAPSPTEGEIEVTEEPGPTPPPPPFKKAVK